MLAQDLPDRAGRARQSLTQQRGGGVSLEIVVDGFRGGNAAEALRRLVADGENAVDHELREAGRWCMSGRGVPLQYRLILRRGRSPPFEPLFHPRARPTNCIR